MWSMSLDLDARTGAPTIMGRGELRSHIETKKFRNARVRPFQYEIKRVARAFVSNCDFFSSEIIVGP